MDRRLALRAGLVQFGAVLVLALVLGLALGHRFFEHNGWWAGPGAWFACAALTASVVRLPVGPVLIGAALAGVPSALATILGLHWEGALLAVILLGLWCGRLGRDPGLLEDTV